MSLIDNLPRPTVTFLSAPRQREKEEEDDDPPAKKPKPMANADEDPFLPVDSSAKKPKPIIITDDDEDDLFLCPLCLLHLGPRIPQCASGHWMCDLCLEKHVKDGKKKCPSCHALLTSVSNNLFMHQQATKPGVNLRCAAKASGCTFVGTYVQVCDHERKDCSKIHPRKLCLAAQLSDRIWELHNRGMPERPGRCSVMCLESQMRDEVTGHHEFRFPLESGYSIDLIQDPTPRQRVLYLWGNGLSAHILLFLITPTEVFFRMFCLETAEERRKQSPKGWLVKFRDLSSALPPLSKILVIGGAVTRAQDFLAGGAVFTRSLPVSLLVEMGREVGSDVEIKLDVEFS
jgi:hypothetical protein